MLTRRSLLRGLFAAPAVVVVGSLMPLRGIKFNPLMRVQTWPFDTQPVGEWWAHEGPLSGLGRIEEEMKRLYGGCYSENIERPIITGVHVSKIQNGGGMLPQYHAYSKNDGGFGVYRDCEYSDGAVDPELSADPNISLGREASRFGIASGADHVDPPQESQEEFVKSLRPFYRAPNVPYKAITPAMAARCPQAVDLLFAEGKRNEPRYNEQRERYAASTQVLKDCAKETIRWGV